MKHNIFSNLFKPAPRRARHRSLQRRLRHFGPRDLCQWSDRNLSDIGCRRSGDWIGIDADF